MPLMRLLPLVVLAFLVSLAAVAREPAKKRTLAESYVQTGLEALNGSDVAWERYRGPLPRDAELRARSGGLDVTSWQASHKAVFADARHRTNGNTVRIELVLSDDQPARVPHFLALGSPLMPADAYARNQWRVVPGGEGTGCAFGTPYESYYRAGDPTKLLVYFQGGGACWNDATCTLGKEPYFLYVTDDRMHPARWRGLLDFFEPRNPVKDYSMLFVSYCTGDLGLGAAIRKYQVAGVDGQPATLSVDHRGAANQASAMAFLEGLKLAPEKVLVAGVSAGSIMSAYRVADIAARYPGAHVVQIGDGAGAFRSQRIAGIVAQWDGTQALKRLPGLEALDARSFTHEDYTKLASKAAPRVMFSQIDMTRDVLQYRYLKADGMDRSIPELLAEAHGDIRKSVPGFLSYNADQEHHVTLLLPYLYRLEVDGVRLSDWIADLMAGKKVGSVGSTLLK
jgi:hypothetical protein